MKFSSLKKNNYFKRPSQKQLSTYFISFDGFNISSVINKHFGNELEQHLSWKAFTFVSKATSGKKLGVLFLFLKFSISRNCFFQASKYVSVSFSCEFCEDDHDQRKVYNVLTVESVCGTYVVFFFVNGMDQRKVCYEAPLEGILRFVYHVLSLE